MKRNKSEVGTLGFDDEEGTFDGQTFYSMETWAHGHPAVYTSGSWFGLGWQIFKHRLNHLIKDGRWKD